MLVARDHRLTDALSLRTECLQVPRSAMAPAGFVCRCSPGWSGDLCTIENACNSHDCGSNSYCQNDGQGMATYTCPCLVGYSRAAGSDDCIMIDLCDTAPCDNGGVCTSSLEAYECTCPAGFAGSQCELEVDGCEFNHQPCGVFGECQSDWNQPNGYMCTCRDSYSGTNCNNPPQDICSVRTNPCQHGAECESQGGSRYVCTCQPSWSGDNCADFVDPCQNAPCGIHGRCESVTSVPGTFTCQCSDAFTGDRCTIAPIEANGVCTTAPCQNGGYCEEQQGSYDCYCLPGFTGDNCESDIDECACADRSDDLRAISRLTAALDCEIAMRLAGDCSFSLAAFNDPQGRTLAQLCPFSCGACEAPCGEHGLCVDAVNRRSCTCIDGWTQSATCREDDCPCTEPPITSGSCSGVVCQASRQCKTAGVCQCTAGVCQCTAENDVPNYTPCDDGRANNGRDQCIGGVCTGQQPPIRPPPSPSPPTGTTRPAPPTPPPIGTRPTVTPDMDVLHHLQFQVRPVAFFLPQPPHCRHLASASCDLTRLNVMLRLFPTTSHSGNPWCRGGIIK